MGFVCGLEILVDFVGLGGIEVERDSIASTNQQTPTNPSIRCSNKLQLGLKTQPHNRQHAPIGPASMLKSTAEKAWCRQTEQNTKSPEHHAARHPHPPPTLHEAGYLGCSGRVVAPTVDRPVRITTL